MVIWWKREGSSVQLSKERTYCEVWKPWATVRKLKVGLRVQVELFFVFLKLLTEWVRKETKAEFHCPFCCCIPNIQWRNKVQSVSLVLKNFEQQGEKECKTESWNSVFLFVLLLAGSYYSEEKMCTNLRALLHVLITETAMNG
jgi:hypothetical protein